MNDHVPHGLLSLALLMAAGLAMRAHHLAQRLAHLKQRLAETTVELPSTSANGTRKPSRTGRKLTRSEGDE